jgi:hypothetical protein
MGSEVLKKIYLKVVIFIFVFIFLTAGYFFLLNFYSKKILGKIKEINNLEEKIIQYQSALQKQNQLEKMKILIEQKSKKELPAILFDLQQKLNKDFETMKKLILDKIQQENWKIIQTNFNLGEKKLNFVFQIPEYDFSKFYDFIIENGLIWQMTDFKIEKNNDLWQVELNLQTR